MPNFKDLLPVVIILITSPIALPKPGFGPGSRFFNVGPVVGAIGPGPVQAPGPILGSEPFGPKSAPAAVPPPPPGPPGAVLAPVGPHGVEEIVVESPNQIRHSVKHDMRSSKREETVFDADDRFPTTTVTLDDDYGTTVYRRPLVRPGFGMGIGGFAPGPEPGFLGYPMGNPIARTYGFGQPSPFRNNAF